VIGLGPPCTLPTKSGVGPALSTPAKPLDPAKVAETCKLDDVPSATLPKQSVAGVKK
jgi:hypothetical protein